MDWYVVQQGYWIELPDTPYNLCISGELWDYINAEEGAKVEIIGGDICIDGAPRPPIPDSPRARSLTVREAFERSQETARQFLAQREEELKPQGVEGSSEGLA